jgi:hypothetical protein
MIFTIYISLSCLNSHTTNPALNFNPSNHLLNPFDCKKKKNGGDEQNTIRERYQK